MVDSTKYARYTINKQGFTAKARISKKITNLPNDHKKFFRGESMMDLEMKIKTHLDFAGLQKRKNQWVFHKD
tara:strand:+ start:302 stop:517 length:216 start_codon:yes stop_codon:yes gene_type:complete